jgi:putative flippase GtrA
LIDKPSTASTATTAKVWQLLRYVVVGGLNTALSLAVYYLALHGFGLPYYLASGLAVLLGIVVGFKAHGALVFNNKGSFFRYVLVWVAIYLGNIALIALVRDVTGDTWAPIVLLPFTTLLAYVLLKKLVYKPAPPVPTPPPR